VTHFCRDEEESNARLLVRSSRTEYNADPHGKYALLVSAVANIDIRVYTPGRIAERLAGSFDELHLRPETIPADNQDSAAESQQPFVTRKQRDTFYQYAFSLLLSSSRDCEIRAMCVSPIWAHGIQLWDAASNSNMETLQRFQNEYLRIIANAPCYVTTDTLHHDLNLSCVRDEIKSQR